MHSAAENSAALLFPRDRNRWEASGSAWVGEAMIQSPSRMRRTLCCYQNVTKITLCFSKSEVYNPFNEFV